MKNKNNLIEYQRRENYLGCIHNLTGPVQNMKIHLNLYIQFTILVQSLETDLIL